MSQKTDSLVAIKYQKWLMTLTAMWPVENPTRLYRATNYFILFCVILVTGILTIEMSVQLNNIEVFNDMLTIMMSVACYVIKHVIYQIKFKSFEKMLNFIKTEIFFDYPDELDRIMQDDTGLVSRINILYQIACFLAMVLLVVKPFIFYAQTHTFLPMYPITFLNLSSAAQPALHVFEAFSFFCAVNNNSCLDTASGGFIIIAATHFKILNRKISDCRKWVELRDGKMEADKKDINENINNWLAQCVEHHNAILSLVKSIENTFNMCYLVQCLASVIVICNIGFQLVHTEVMIQLIAMTIYLFAMLTQLALYCWFGDNLMEHSEYVKDACYLSDWVNFNLKVRKTLFIIMERSKKPVYLTAGGFAILSLDSYKSILKSAYSYFALMQTLYSETETELAMQT